MFGVFTYTAGDTRLGVRRRDIDEPLEDGDGLYQELLGEYDTVIQKNDESLWLDSNTLFASQVTFAFGAVLVLVDVLL